MTSIKLKDLVARFEAGVEIDYESLPATIDKTTDISEVLWRARNGELMISDQFPSKALNLAQPLEGDFDPAKGDLSLIAKEIELVAPNADFPLRFMAVLKALSHNLDEVHITIDKLDVGDKGEDFHAERYSKVAHGGKDALSMRMDEVRKNLASPDFPANIKVYQEKTPQPLNYTLGCAYFPSVVWLYWFGFVRPNQKDGLDRRFVVFPNYVGEDFELPTVTYDQVKSILPQEVQSMIKAMKS